jgi:hypothetical protein
LEEIEPYTREVVHKVERLDRQIIEEIIREKDSSGPRRRPQVEEDVQPLPRCPRRRRKTPSEVSP